ncbi:MAG: flippase [Halarchaeum sp.]
MTDETDANESDSADSFASVRKLFKGGGVVFAGIVLELGVSFVGKILIARYLGRASYGGVSLGIITAAIASTLVLLGLNTGIARYLPRDEGASARRSVLVSAFRIAVPLSVVLGGVLALLAPFLSTHVFHDSSLTPILRVFSISIPFAAVMKLSLGAVQGRQLPAPKVMLQNITLPVSRLLGIAVVLLVGLGTIGVSYAYLASYVLAALVGCYYLYTRTTLFETDIAVVGRERELLVFSLPLAMSAAMTIILSDTDMYMLGALQGTASVGLYNVAYPLAQLLTTALGSFGFLFMPALSELEAAGEETQMRRLYQLVTKWVVVATLPVFLLFVVFPDSTIRYTFGVEYLPGAAALAVLSVGFFVNAAFGLNRGALTSLGHTRVLMIIDIATAVFNVVLNLLLIPKFGLLGAAYATAASYIVLNTLCSYHLYSSTGIHPFTRSMVVAPVIGSATLAGMYAVAQTYVAMTLPVILVMFATFLAVYVVAMVRFAVDPEDIRLVLSIEERFDVDFGPVKRLATALME